MGSSIKTRMVSFRMSVVCYEKIEKALKTYNNHNTSVADYCKENIERYAFRHQKKVSRTDV